MIATQKTLYGYPIRTTTFYFSHVDVLSGEEISKDFIDEETGFSQDEFAYLVRDKPHSGDRTIYAKSETSAERALLIAQKTRETLQLIEVSGIEVDQLILDFSKTSF